MAYKGKFTPSNPNKYVGDSTRIIYRSLWERKFMVYLDTSSQIKEWSSEEISVPYFDPNTKKMRQYFPDFVVKLAHNDSILMIEIKPKRQTIEPKPPKTKTRASQIKFLQASSIYAMNDAKWKAARDYCDKRGWNFKLMTQDDLGINYKK
jgi:hypothetical protein